MQCQLHTLKFTETMVIRFEFKFSFQCVGDVFDNKGLPKIPLKVAYFGTVLMTVLARSLRYICKRSKFPCNTINKTYTKRRN